MDTRCGALRFFISQVFDRFSQHRAIHADIVQGERDAERGDEVLQVAPSLQRDVPKGRVVAARSAPVGCDFAELIRREPIVMTGRDDLVRRHRPLPAAPQLAIAEKLRIPSYRRPYSTAARRRSIAATGTR